MLRREQPGCFSGANLPADLTREPLWPFRNRGQEDSNNNVTDRFLPPCERLSRQPEGRFRAVSAVRAAFRKQPQVFFGGPITAKTDTYENPSAKTRNLLLRLDPKSRTRRHLVVVAVRYRLHHRHNPRLDARRQARPRVCEAGQVGVRLAGADGSCSAFCSTPARNVPFLRRYRGLFGSCSAHHETASRSRVVEKGAGDRRTGDRRLTPGLVIRRHPAAARSPAVPCSTFSCSDLARPCCSFSAKLPPLAGVVRAGPKCALFSRLSDPGCA